MRSVILFLLFMGLLEAKESSRVFDCTKIFEQRKAELVLQLERIDEQEQALDALKQATQNLLDKKEQKLKKERSKLEEMKADIEAKKADIEKLVETNKKLLADIKAAKMEKVTGIYAKMKAGAAATIFEKMDPKKASEILKSLPEKVLGKVFAKMKPETAALLTGLLNE